MKSDIDQLPQPEKRPWITPEIELISGEDIESGSSPIYHEGLPEPFFPFRLGSMS